MTSVRGRLPHAKKAQNSFLRDDVEQVFAVGMDEHACFFTAELEFLLDVSGHNRLLKRASFEGRNLIMLEAAEGLAWERGLWGAEDSLLVVCCCSCLVLSTKTKVECSTTIYTQRKYKSKGKKRRDLVRGGNRNLAIISFYKTKDKKRRQRKERTPLLNSYKLVKAERRREPQLHTSKVENDGTVEEDMTNSWTPSSKSYSISCSRLPFELTQNKARIAANSQQPSQKIWSKMKRQMFSLGSLYICRNIRTCFVVLFSHEI